MGPALLPETLASGTYPGLDPSGAHLGLHPPTGPMCLPRPLTKQTGALIAHRPTMRSAVSDWVLHIYFPPKHLRPHGNPGPHGESLAKNFLSLTVADMGPYTSHAPLAAPRRCCLNDSHINKLFSTPEPCVSVNSSGLIWMHFSPP